MRYTSADLILNSYTEKRESRVKFGKRKLAFNLWVDIIGARLPLDGVKDKEHYVKVRGRQYILNGSEWLEHTRHNDFEVREGRSPSFFVQVPGSKVICFSVCAASYNNVQHSMTEKKKRATLLYWKMSVFQCILFSSNICTCSTVYDTALTSFLRATTWKPSIFYVRGKVCSNQKALNEFRNITEQYVGRGSGTKKDDRSDRGRGTIKAPLQNAHIPLGLLNKKLQQLESTWLVHS